MEGEKEFLKMFKCEYCKKRLFDDSLAGSYTDHYLNFSKQFDTLIIKSADKICAEICYYNITIRERNDIINRTNCLKKFCERTNNIDKFNEVFNLVKKELKKQQFLDEIHHKIYDLVKGLSEREKEYIGLKYQHFDFEE